MWEGTNVTLLDKLKFVALVADIYKYGNNFYRFG